MPWPVWSNWHIRSVLIIHELHVCLLAKIYLWPHNQCSQCFHGHLWTCTEQQKIWIAQCTYSQLRLNKAVPCSPVSAHINKYTFCGLFSTNFFAFLCILLVLSLFNMGLKHRAGVLSSVPKFRKAVLCLTEKIFVPGMLRTGVNYSVAGQEFSVNESTMCSIY